jgi:MFS transporter, FHS family, glucose/mannose:H+ symporter
MTAGADRRVIGVLHVGFVLSGMATTLLGPMMPLLMSRWALSDAAAGTLFTAQFAGQMLSTFGSSLLTTRLGDRRTLALGALVTAIGITALTVVSWPFAILVAFVYGTGLGLVLPITNFVVAALRPANAASALSLLNVSWGLGAVLWPLVVRVSMGGLAGNAPLLMLGAAMGVLSVLLLSRAESWPAGGRAASAHLAEEGRAIALRGRVAGLVAVFAALSFLYVGAEISVGGWIAEFTRRAGSGAAAIWALAPTAFWGAETLGRLLAPLSLRRMSENALMASGLCGAGVAVLLLVTASSSVELALGGAVLAGLGLAPVYPLLIAAMSRHITPVAPRLMGPLFAMGGLGGATLPWLVGLTSDRTGELRAGLGVPLTALGVMVALDAARRRLERQA